MTDTVSRCRCVSRKHHDRSAIPKLGTNRSRRRAGRSDASASPRVAHIRLSNDDRAAAEGGLLFQLDNSSPLVRRAMADVFARSASAPPAIVRALSVDQPSVAIPILEHSPLLIDADLVDIVATGSCEVQCAVARRVQLPVSCAALAEVGSAAAALELIEIGALISRRCHGTDRRAAWPFEAIRNRCWRSRICPGGGGEPG